MVYKRKRPRFPIKTVLVMYFGGRSTEEIAEKLGYTRPAVAYQLKKAGIILRARGGANNIKPICPRGHIKELDYYLVKSHGYILKACGICKRTASLIYKKKK